MNRELIINTSSIYTSLGNVKSIGSLCMFTAKNVPASTDTGINGTEIADSTMVQTVTLAAQMATGESGIIGGADVEAVVKVDEAGNESADEQISDEVNEKQISDESADEQISDESADEQISDESADEQISDEVNEEQISDESADEQISDEVNDEQISDESNDQDSINMDEGENTMNEINMNSSLDGEGLNGGDLNSETMAAGDLKGVKDPMLSSWPFVIGISFAVLFVSIVFGAFMAKLKIKKGIDSYED
jgi:hypothetical protein